ncbi:MAG: hypothetical protein J6R20_02365 [Clostridia bacterium]|jgi:hypothetical protein|nr:hypothetical protein [Clostridia bacterium]
MNAKRITALAVSILMILSLGSCKDNSPADSPEESTSLTQISNNVTDNVIAAPSSPVTESDTALSIPDDPATWTAAQTVDAYKNAAAKTTAKAVSQRKIDLKSISVNNGEFEGLFEFITPIMSKLLANNSEDVDGITGGFKNLTEADVSSAKAYKNGNNTVIEMKMKNQTAGMAEDANSGSVGHAITAVGDITVVTKQLKDLGLPLELSEKDTKIIYTDATVKVTVNPDGEIISGTWSYTVEIRMDNYKAFGKTVNTTSVIMKNTITLK